MSVVNVLEELKLRYREALDETGFAREQLRHTDLERWSSQLSISRNVLCDQLALQLALGFYRRELSFSFCDSIVNDMCGVIVQGHEQIPELFWDVYLAFDAGEYYHGDDERTVDPVEKYTRPLIDETITKHGRP